MLDRLAIKEFNMDYDEAVIEASGQFLTSHLPEDWQEWEDDEQDEFIIDHAWQPFEYWEAKDIWSEIDQLASVFVRISKGD